ncbi:MAG: PAS domain S-box protein, partial [Bacteroidales bacterium]|nr:PAS domain S-box protein [Bacteroidales bacterium]
GDMNLDVWDKKLRNGESVLTTEKKRKKDGTEYWTEVIVTQIEFRGELAGLSINRDITERKQTEEELKAREKRANNQRIAIAKIAIDKTLTDINLYEGFRNITEVVSTAIIVERISIWILSEDGLTLNCMSLYETGKKKHSSGTSLLAENFPCYFDAIKKESRIYAYDAQADPRTAELKDEYLVPLGITSMLDAGINIDGKLSGVICMEHIGEKRKWEVDEEAFVSTVASIIAQAIINSKRLRAEEILLKMNKAINNSGEVILMTDKEGIITFVNPEFTKMYGYTAEEVIGKVTPRILKSGIHEPEVYENFWHTLLNKQSFKGFHYINKCKNGRIIDAEASADPILDDNGEITGFLAIQRDISERIRSEKIQNVLLNISNATQEANDLAEILKIIQKELGRLMDAENFFVALYDEETDRIHLPYYQDEKDEIKDFPAGKTLTGLVIKQGESLLIDSAEAKKLEAENKIEKVGLDSEIWLGVPLKIKGKVTGAFVVQSYTNPNAYTEKDKEVLEIISHQISISIERKREEAKLLAALEAVKESDRIKTAFLANMSHELRTPLNAVIGFSELIDANTEAADSFEYAQLINKSGKNLLGIVDEIFEMTLIERGQLDLKRSKMSISFFLNDIYQTILHRQINQGDTTIKIEQKIKGIDSQTEGFTDFNKLKQICLSVLGNALKFTEEGFIRFGVFPSEDEKDFVFFVKDTGIGIPKEMHKSIFERFKIADESLTRKYAGIGAGLFISRKLIALLGGEIWLESEEGKGSTFYFKIPR